MPDELESLLEIARIKQLATKNFVIKISNKRESLVFTFENSKFNPQCIDKLIKKYGTRIRFSPGIKPMITLRLNNVAESCVIKETKEFLKNL